MPNAVAYLDESTAAGWERTSMPSSPRRSDARPGAVGSVSKGEGQSRQTDQVEIPCPAATFCLVANGR